MLSTKGLKFDGTAGLKGVSVPYSVLLHPTDALTLEAWIYVKADTITKTTNSILSTTEGGGFSMYINSDLGSVNTFSINININGTYKAAYASNTLFKLNEYNHVSGTFDGRYIKLYLNGELVGVNDLGTSGNKIKYSYNNILAIGSDADKYGENGKFATVLNYNSNTIITDVRVWNYARDINDIKKYMNRILSNKDNGLVGYWRFNEGEGDIVNDSSIYGHHGKIYSVQWCAVDGLYFSSSNFLLQSNNSFFSIKPEYYPEGSSGYIPINIVDLTSNDFENYGFIQLDDLVKDKTVNDEIFRPIDKFDNSIKIFKVR